jgi:hypothetical protein
MSTVLSNSTKMPMSSKKTVKSTRIRIEQNIATAGENQRWASQWFFDSSQVTSLQNILQVKSRVT